MKRPLANNAGMSLLEVTFAMGILATALSLLFGSLISITVISRLNEERAVASTEVASVLEEMRDMRLVDLLQHAPEPPGAPGVEQAVQFECYDGAGTAVALPLNIETDAAGQPVEPLPNLPNPLEVKVTLLWTNEAGQVYESFMTASIGR